MLFKKDYSFIAEGFINYMFIYNTTNEILIKTFSEFGITQR